MKGFISLLNIVLVLGLLVVGCAPREELAKELPSPAPTPTPTPVPLAPTLTLTPPPTPMVRIIGPAPGPPRSGEAPYTSADPTIDGMATSFEEWAEAFHYPNEFNDGVYSNAGYFYTQNKDDWRATSSRGNSATLPGVTFFLAHDIWGQPDGLFYMFRTPTDNHWNMAEVTLPGENIVQCWILAFGDTLDDSNWLSASGLENSSLISEGSGNNLINDVGFIVRLNRDPATDRHWFPGDPVPGDPEWNDEEYYGCFGMWGFNNSFYATGLDPDPAHSDENVVYEWKFSGVPGDRPIQCQEIKIVIKDPPKDLIVIFAPDWWIHILPPSLVSPPAPTAKEYVADCNTYLEQGKPLLVEHTDCTEGIRLLRLAIEKSTTALELEPDNAEAYFCRGMSRRWLEEELNEAVEDLQRALDKGLEGDKRAEAETELAKLREKVAAPISVSMGPITCAEGWTESGEPINPGTIFSGCKKEIWCRWGLSSPSGEQGVTKWYYNGELTCQHGHEFKDSWTWAESGWAVDPGEECIKPGTYCVAAYIGTTKMTEGCFTIE